MTLRFFLALASCLGWLGVARPLHAQPATPGDSMLQQELKQHGIAWRGGLSVERAGNAEPAEAQGRSEEVV